MSETQFYVWVALTQTVTVVSVLFGVWLNKKNMNVGFDEMAARFADVDAWFDRIEARFDSLDARFSDAEVPRT